MRRQVAFRLLSICARFFSPGFRHRSVRIFVRFFVKLLCAQCSVTGGVFGGGPVSSSPCTPLPVVWDTATMAEPSPAGVEMTHVNAAVPVYDPSEGKEPEGALAGVPESSLAGRNVGREQLLKVCGTVWGACQWFSPRSVCCSSAGACSMWLLKKRGEMRRKRGRYGVMRTNPPLGWTPCRSLFRLTVVCGMLQTWMHSETLQDLPRVQVRTAAFE